MTQVVGASWGSWCVMGRLLIFVVTQLVSESRVGRYLRGPQDGPLTKQAMNVVPFWGYAQRLHRDNTIGCNHAPNDTS